jgi:hypothetical protein
LSNNKIMEDFVWRPTLKQEKFLSIPFSVKEAFFAGAMYAGKSDVLLMYPIVHEWIKDSDFKGLFLRRTMTEHKEEIIPRSKNYYRPFGGVFNKNDAVWEFPSGALIFFGHCEHEDDVHKYDTVQWNYVAFDELTSFTEWQYLYITIERTRRATKYSTIPAVVRSASNPGNIGHLWVKRRFIDPCPEGNSIIQGKGGLKRIFIPANVDDNPHADEQYKRELDALPEAERQAKKFGNWSAYEGQVFEEFRDRKYPDEPDNAMHVIEPFEIPEFWPKIIGMDWGFAPPAMTWVGYGAISPQKRIYIYREQAWQKTKIEEWAGYVKFYIEKENPRLIRLCRSASQDRGQEHTIQEQINSAIGKEVELSDNSHGSRIAGKMLLHEYFRWRQKYVPPKEIGQYSDEHSQWLLRNRSTNEYESYLKSFIPSEPEANLPKVQIFFSETSPDRSCPLLINAIKSATYDKTNPQDIAEFPGDDPLDGFRYLIDSVDRYFDESRSEFEKIQQREELVQKLQQNQDWTAFYRNSRALESTTSTQPVRRYH